LSTQNISGQAMIKVGPGIISHSFSFKEYLQGQLNKGVARLS